jgi:predicted metal-binding membrane protein
MSLSVPLMLGGCSMSMAWMPMSGQTWLGAAASFLVMWVVMMVAMMLPSLVPMLWRYRAAIGGVGGTRAALLTVLVSVGYFLVWSALGVAAFALGAGVAAAEMRLSALARGIPIAVGALVLIGGALQFTEWKAHHLACCRAGPARCDAVARREAVERCGASQRGDILRANAQTALRYGVRQGVHCCACCAGLTAILLVAGVMDLRVMAAVTAVITAERIAPAGEQVARAIGAAVVAAGSFLIVRAVALV